MKKRFAIFTALYVGTCAAAIAAASIHQMLGVGVCLCGIMAMMVYGEATRHGGGKK